MVKLRRILCARPCLLAERQALQLAATRENTDITACLCKHLPHTYKASTQATSEAIISFQTLKRTSRYTQKSMTKLLCSLHSYWKNEEFILLGSSSLAGTSIYYYKSSTVSDKGQYYSKLLYICLKITSLSAVKAIKMLETRSNGMSANQI